MILTAAAVGGVEPWTRWQFVGLFGAIEAGSGLANVFTPNVWRLPVAELETSSRTPVRLAASTALLPHWGGLARAVAGLVCLGAAAWTEGLGVASLGLLPLLLALGWMVLALSAVLARLGVARPDLDVVQFVVRWGGRDRAMTPISIGASMLQFLLSIATIPAAKLLPPSVLYRPEVGPSGGALAAVLAVSLALAGLVWLAWFRRLETTAPAEQQREAERHG